MAYYNTTITPGSTGIKTISPGFAPKAIKITVSAKGGEAYSHFSTGSADDSGWTTYHAFYQDTSGGTTKQGTGNNGKIVSILERVSGTITEIGAATFDSFTSTSAKFNVTIVNTNYAYNVELWS